MDTNRVGATLEAGGQPYGIAAIGNTLWVSDETSGDILAIDPESVKVTHRYQVAPGLTDLAAAGGALWVTNVRDRTLRRVDPSTGRSTTVGSNVEEPQELVADGNDLLVAGFDSIGQVDLVTGDAERAFAPNMPSMDIGPDAVWTASSYNTLLQRRDPATLGVVAEQSIDVSAPDWQFAIAATPEGIWLWTYTDDRLVRIEPATP
jgi:streptogramin lyase